jgi:hypothetical protein
MKPKASSRGSPKLVLRKPSFVAAPVLRDVGETVYIRLVHAAGAEVAGFRWAHILNGV